MSCHWVTLKLTNGEEMLVNMDKVCHIREGEITYDNGHAYFLPVDMRIAKQQIKAEVERSESLCYRG